MLLATTSITTYTSVGSTMRTKFYRHIFCALLLILCTCKASQAQIVINSKFEPLSYEELVLHAQAEAARREYNKRQFENYQDEAYRRYNNGDLYGFLTYSNYALGTGWYNDKLYYDRGCVYEKLNDFKNAKKEFKKAKKSGYAYAENALQALKIHEKEYKQRKNRKNR